MHNSATHSHVIVVGVDYSELGELALEHALAIASERPRGQVHAVHVASLAMPVSGLEPAPDITALQMPSIDDSLAELQRYLEERYERFRQLRPGQLFPERVVAHLRFESAAEEIAALASELEADLVVVGTHGRRGLTRMLLGSVAEGVVRLAPCPVLTVREKHFVTIARIEPPCPDCRKVREETHGERLFCDAHSERHGRRHAYRSIDRISNDGTMPLVFRQ